MIEHPFSKDDIYLGLLKNVPLTYNEKILQYVTGLIIEWGGILESCTRGSQITLGINYDRINNAQVLGAYF